VSGCTFPILEEGRFALVVLIGRDGFLRPEEALLRSSSMNLWRGLNYPQSPAFFSPNQFLI